MTARHWKRVGAGVAAAGVVIAGVLLWLGHRERVAKDALAAEIRAERAARVRPAVPSPTVEENATAELYRVALSKVDLEYITSGDSRFEDALDAAPWTSTPQAVTDDLAKNAEALEFSDRALARGACRFDAPSSTSWSRCYRLRRLHFARGYSVLSAGSPVAAAEEVRRLIRLGRDFAATPPPDETEIVGVWPDLHVLHAEQEASRLLAALATAAELPPESAPALLAAARDAWGSAEAIRRSVDVHEVSADAVLLKFLATDADEWLERMAADRAELEELVAVTAASQGLFDKTKDRILRVLRPGTEIPTAAGIREFRAMRAPIVAAHRRRDVVALAPGGPHEETGRLFGFLGPRWFRTTVVYEARIALARTAAAIRARQLRDGRPPRTLDELVPDLPAEVLLDPFDGKPLLYEVEGDAWRVASRVWRERAMAEDETEAASHPVEVRFPRAPK